MTESTKSKQFFKYHTEDEDRDLVINKKIVKWSEIWTPISEIMEFKQDMEDSLNFWEITMQTKAKELSIKTREYREIAENNYARLEAIEKDILQKFVKIQKKVSKLEKIITIQHKKIKELEAKQ